MCGGFVMAYSSAKIDPTSSSFHQFLSHFIYNVGRISAYIILGILFGALGSLFTFSAYVSGYFYFFAGIVMVLMGLSMMGKMKFLTSLESNIAFHPLIKKIFSHLIHTKTLVSFYGLGLLNGFLPCGLVYFFLATAVNIRFSHTRRSHHGSFGMATMPAMLGLGYVVGFLKGSGFRELMIKLASLIIIVYGIYMSYVGFAAVAR
ncbi:MAG: sulfite exporter TauE/SafE family protein [Sulfurospirillum sp.]|nr:sulfite exporter TauE/SafE family protein [Sulfurospirillum sp.]